MTSRRKKSKRGRKRSKHRVKSHKRILKSGKSTRVRAHSRTNRSSAAKPTPTTY